MGFSIDVIADILKFPHPLYPKYKKFINLGFKYNVPPIQTDIQLALKFPKELVYELQYIEIDQNGWMDNDSLTCLLNNKYIFQNVFVKELGQRLNVRPVIKINPELDTLYLIIHNKSGTSRSLFVDFGLSCNKPPSNKISNITYTVTLL